ncbi:Double-stranded RNA-binding protein 7 [Hibiscus syriacus]|uniref:Double-stranded RNA-binding protein 7 n=1 Tax=Hibiscus syriacus TaxID=106335 RepID=A0A6A2Y3J2_HIBSY|nr:double-stranded RNA-binding protein 1-like [Hibiscus syriacus]XP_039041488.1 double-stranded RNA-binding protein 1-like [Hibiscus syriacus]KAE8666759.1 Double-stranded RNA-binding protein 7 [Hibiscus syriacus]
MLHTARKVLGCGPNFPPKYVYFVKIFFQFSVKRKALVSLQAMPTNVNFSGVSNCYVFKSQLQEYAQKAGLPTPVYETIKEGPSHEPSFSSTVTVNNVRYDWLPGFFNRKAAEHSAAKVALRELCKTGEINESISQPVHETGLCKNLLQEYAQKMNFAMPVYQCQKDESAGRLPYYSCTVEIGGIRYIGAAAKTKKEAEIKSTRIALLAIQLTTSESSNRAFNNSKLMVIPFRKWATETASNPDETLKVPKAKKARYKKKMFKRKHFGKNDGPSQDKTTGISVIGSDDLLKPESVQTDSFTIRSSETLGTEVRASPQDTKIESDSCKRDMPSADVALAHQVADSSKNGLLTAVNSIYSNHEAPYMEHKHSIVFDDLTDLVKLTDSSKIASMDDPTLGQLNQAVDRIHANAGQG